MRPESQLMNRTIYSLESKGPAGGRWQTSTGMLRIAWAPKSSYIFQKHQTRLSTKKQDVCTLNRCTSVQLFAAVWTVACQALCPWDSPGKNTGVG